MNTLNLIYVNTDFKTMIDFEVEISVSYEMAYEKYGATRYIPELLKRSRPIIQAFGDAIKMPNAFVEGMNDQELDYLLILLHTSVDALIDGHIYVRLPSKHAINLTSGSNANEIWRANGMGLNGLLLARMDHEKKLLISLPTFEETQEEFIIHSEKQTKNLR